MLLPQDIHHVLAECESLQGQLHQRISDHQELDSARIASWPWLSANPLTVDIVEEARRVVPRYSTCVRLRPNSSEALLR